MANIGVDAHVITGKFQGSRTWLIEMLRAIGQLDKDNTYFLYSDNPILTRQMFPFSNFEHRELRIFSAVPRLMLFWPYAGIRDRLDYLMTQYIAPPWFPGRQIVVVHDILFESHPHLFPPSVRWRNRLLVRQSARRAFLVLTVSEFSRRAIERFYDVASDRIVVTYNGVSPAPGRIGPPPDGVARPYILTVGRLEPRKNIETLLAAHARAGIDNLELVIVGREDFGVDRLTEKIRSAPRVQHLRDVDDALLDRLYRHAAAVVVPSYAEGFGLPIIEALIRGTPVICSNTTAMPEVGGRFARYFDPTATDAVETLAGLIRSTVAAPPAMGDLAAHIAQFSWERSASRLLEALHRSHCPGNPN
jgi:glycosyltransferase involved in cell wall biosynthesis